MEKEQIFTSTGMKLLYHPKVIISLQKGKVIPISLQIAPTSKCQLKCVFCSNTNRTKDEDIQWKQLTRFIEDMGILGAKTIEWTGGGDPSLYPEMNGAILYAHIRGYEQGMITNGLGFEHIISSLGLLKWIRISLNCLDYVDNIEIPKLSKKTTLGFSYVMNNKTTEESLLKVQKIVGKYKPEYVRIVPNCQATDEEQKRNNKHYSKVVNKMGHPYFYQAKVFGKPDKCYWGYLKPFVNFDGSVFRCSSIVLNDDAERSFHNKYRWCHISELKNVYNKPIIPYIPDNCNKCVFTKQNNLVDSIIHPNKMENFI